MGQPGIKEAIPELERNHRSSSQEAGSVVVRHTHHMCIDVVGDTGGGRVKSGQEEIRARPGPLLCHPFMKARGLSQDFTRDSKVI